MESNEPKLPVEPAGGEELDSLQQRVRQIPDQKWERILWLTGLPVGAFCGFLITYVGSFPSVGMYGTIGAMLIALLAPRLAERRLQRQMKRVRGAILIGLAAWLAGFAIWLLLSGQSLTA